MDDTAKDQEAKALRFLKFCTGRFGQEAKGDHQTAAELGFRSPEMLYKQLELDGSPVCGVCGQLYPDPEHPKEHKKPRPRRPGSGGGHRVKLPDASRALDLFHTALKELEERIWSVDLEDSWLEGTVEEGEFKGKRFITVASDPNALEVKERHTFSEEEWKELCEQHGVPPTEEILHSDTVLTVPEGVKIAPSNELVSLIAAYSLTDLPSEPLLAALHPGSPSTEERQLVQEATDRLKKVAEHLARRVRRGIVGRGPDIVEIPMRDHFLASQIRQLKQEGVRSDEELCERLKGTFIEPVDWLTPEEVSRIRRLGVRPPE